MAVRFGEQALLTTNDYFFLEFRFLFDFTVGEYALPAQWFFFFFCGKHFLATTRNNFFEQEIKERKSKSFKTKKRLRELIGGEIRQQDVAEEIQHNKGTVKYNNNIPFKTKGELNA